MSIFSDFINLFFPALCLSCNDRLVNGEEYLCLSCLGKIPKTNYHNIRNNKLEMLFAGRFPFAGIASYAYFVKGGIIQSVIHELKYKNKPELGEYLGKLCGQEIKESSFLRKTDLIVPVPLHPNRLKQRGYNQAEMIAQGISSITNIPVSRGNMMRIIDNTSQTKQSRSGRWANTEGIFDIKEPEIFNDKHILLVDDILTTGSTVESCIKALTKKCTNSNVSIFTIGAAI